jgi:putative Holliday junction resolvase
MGRILGVDLGARRIGLAVSDPTGLIATPLRVLDRSGDATGDRRRIVEAAREEEADRIVVGMPTELSGRAGPAAAAAAAEVAALRALAPDLAVDVVDERLTTVIAQRSLIDAGVRRKERKGTVDKVAAAVLLQSYLDAHRSRG